MGWWSLGGKETSSHCLGRACGNDIALEEKLLHGMPTHGDNALGFPMLRHNLDDLHEKHIKSDKNGGPMEMGIRYN